MRKSLIALTALCGLAAGGCGHVRETIRDGYDLASSGVGTAKSALKNAKETGVYAWETCIDAPDYKSNGLTGIKEGDFSDKDFDARRSLVKMPAGVYVFGDLLPSQAAIIDGKTVGLEELFPKWGVKTSEMTEHISETERTVSFGRSDGKVRVWQRDPTIAYLATNRTFKPKQLPEGRRAGDVDESDFDEPQVDDILKGEPVAYASLEDGSLVLVRKPSYRLNHATGFAEIFGDMYAEKEATLETVDENAENEDFAEAVRKKAEEIEEAVKAEEAKKAEEAAE